ncbi:Hsp20/alpha crystallin family protein [Metabacillus litoralis]|uniref:Hsp20/alpha crystallin family protein n=2 Tax=Metabacillus litoralis TaxID=152268 RepID=UPI00203A8C94|nr:Hsp20 family protein [Metabacillus litoralis]MCM3161396.1 Hsp20 family protein [Metabacillus litoralis]
MNIRKCSNPMNIKGIEEWMTQFFTDPFTSLLDEHTFRVDLFETSDQFIIEGEIGENIKKENINIHVSQEQITIKVIKENKAENHETNEVTRKVVLPYRIEKKQITATFTNGVLEIKISKTSDSESSSSCINIIG